VHQLADGRLPMMLTSRIVITTSPAWLMTSTNDVTASFPHRSYRTALSVS
jgi:hypothetical protein